MIKGSNIDFKDEAFVHAPAVTGVFSMKKRMEEAFEYYEFTQMETRWYTMSHRR